jgi:hypothetical protein
MLSVIMLNAAMLSVVSPGKEGTNVVLVHSYWPWPLGQR